MAFTTDNLNKLSPQCKYCKNLALNAMVLKVDGKLSSTKPISAEVHFLLVHFTDLYIEPFTELGIYFSVSELVVPRVR